MAYTMSATVFECITTFINIEFFSQENTLYGKLRNQILSNRPSSLSGNTLDGKWGHK